MRCFFGRNAKSVAFVSVPAAVASTLLKAGKIPVEWVIAKIVLPFRRRAICVRCCNPGYFGSSCGVSGEKGHRAREYKNAVCCAAADRTTNYRLGGPYRGAPLRKGRIHDFELEGTQEAYSKAVSSLSEPKTNGLSHSS